MHIHSMEISFALMFANTRTVGLRAGNRLKQVKENRINTR